MTTAVVANGRSNCVGDTRKDATPRVLRLQNAYARLLSRAELSLGVAASAGTPTRDSRIVCEIHMHVIRGSIEHARGINI